MKKPSKNILKEMDDFFSQPLTVNQKAWSIINEFYHVILTHMEKHNIKQSELASRLGRSRSSVSQMFKKTPNITVRKMVEIADALGLDIDVVPSSLKKEIEKKAEEKYIIMPVSNEYFSKEVTEKPMIRIRGDESFSYIACNDILSEKNLELPH